MKRRHYDTRRLINSLIPTRPIFLIFFRFDANALSTLSSRVWLIGKGFNFQIYVNNEGPIYKINF